MRFAILAHATVITLASVGLISCDDPVPPTPRGAWSVSFQPQSGATTMCPIMGHNAIVGAVTVNTHEHLISDGTSEAGESAEVECSVVETPTGSKKFNVYAKMLSEDKGLSFKVDGLTGAATAMSPAPGSASYNSSTTANPYSNPSDKPCQFSFVPSSGEGIDKGRIWVSFVCPSVVDSTSANAVCEIKQGFAIFENCSQVASAN